MSCACARTSVENVIESLREGVRIYTYAFWALEDIDAMSIVLCFCNKGVINGGKCDCVKEEREVSAEEVISCNESILVRGFLRAQSVINASIRRKKCINSFF